MDLPQFFRGNLKSCNRLQPRGPKAAATRAIKPSQCAEYVCSFCEKVLKLFFFKLKLHQMHSREPLENASNYPSAAPVPTAPPEEAAAPLHKQMLAKDVSIPIAS